MPKFECQKLFTKIRFVLSLLIFFPRQATIISTDVTKLAETNPRWSELNFVSVDPKMEYYILMKPWIKIKCGRE